MRSRSLPGISWTNLELEGLLEDTDSRVQLERLNKHVALLPNHLLDLSAAIRQKLDANINVYDPELKGFALAYRSPKIMSPTAGILHDSCFIHIDIEADFYVFRPEVGQSLKGFVNKKGTNHIGVLVHNTFHVSIPEPDRLEQWPDVENEEEWPGKEVRLGQEIRLTVQKLDFKARLPYIRGILHKEDYLRNCKLFNEEIASTNNHALQGISKQSSRKDNSYDKKKNKVTVENKHTVFKSDSEEDVGPENTSDLQEISKQSSRKDNSYDKKKNKVTAEKKHTVFKSDSEEDVGPENTSDLIPIEKIKKEISTEEEDSIRHSSKKRKKKSMHQENGEESLTEENSGKKKKSKIKSENKRVPNGDSKEDSYLENKLETIPIIDNIKSEPDSDVPIKKPSKKRKKKSEFQDDSQQSLNEDIPDDKKKVKIKTEHKNTHSSDSEKNVSLKTKSEKKSDIKKVKQETNSQEEEPVKNSSKKRKRKSMLTETESDSEKVKKPKLRIKQSELFDE